MKHKIPFIFFIIGSLISIIPEQQIKLDFQDNYVPISTNTCNTIFYNDYTNQVYIKMENDEHLTEYNIGYTEETYSLSVDRIIRSFDQNNKVIIETPFVIYSDPLNDEWTKDLYYHSNKIGIFNNIDENLWELTYISYNTIMPEDYYQRI